MKRIGLPFLLLSLALTTGAAFLALFPTHTLAAQKVPTNWQKGAVLLNFGPNPYRPESQEAINALAATGANWMSLAPIWYMDSKTSTRIYADEKRASPSDASILQSIGWARAHGLKVMIKPYFDVKDLTWRAEIAPGDIDAWWGSYRFFIFHYADIAAQTGAEELVIGTELISMTGSQYDSRWIQLIADLRTRYHGLLTYSANWGKSNAEYQTISWWDKLDQIGISAYFPLALGDNPTTQQLIDGWSNFTDAYGGTYHWVNDIAAVQKRFNLPVIFPEIGFGSYPNTAARWDVTESTQLDFEAQRRAYEATLTVWSQQPWFAGLYWWYWDTDPKGVDSDTGQSPRGKPAEQVVADWYGGVTTPVQPKPAYKSPTPTTVPTPTAPPTPQISTDAPLGPKPVSPSPYAGNPAFERVPPFADSSDKIYLVATGHSLSGDFLDYWLTHGGLALFGYPISEPFSEISPTDGNSYVVQWFERNRLELHPELPPDYRVSLGLLGVQLAQGRAEPAFLSATPLPDQRYFTETGHSLGSPFLDVWQARGGLAIFGYPISEVFAERSPNDGKIYMVQYFERARFEYHPEHLGSDQEVQLGLLGRIVTGR